MSAHFWLADAQMARLEPFFPKSQGKPCVDDRRVLSGIIFMNGNSLRWRDAPAGYGPYKTLYSRWKRWNEKGTFARILLELADQGGAEKGGVYSTLQHRHGCPGVYTSADVPHSGSAHD